MLKFSGLSPRGRGPEGRLRFRATADTRSRSGAACRSSLSEFRQHTGSNTAGPLLIGFGHTSPTAGSHISLDHSTAGDSRRASSLSLGRAGQSATDGRHTEGGGLCRKGRTWRPVRFLSGRSAKHVLRERQVSPTGSRQPGNRGELPNAPRWNHRRRAAAQLRQMPPGWMLQFSTDTRPGVATTLVSAVAAMCVQLVDASHNLAIHMLTRILLRSSSTHEPSDPPLEVVNFL